MRRTRALGRRLVATAIPYIRHARASSSWPQAAESSTAHPGSPSYDPFNRRDHVRRVARKDGPMSDQVWQKLSVERQGQLDEAVRDLELMVLQRSFVSRDIWYSVLKGCIAKKDSVLSRRVHDLIVRSGYEGNAFLANHIIRMYASQGSLSEATEVFSQLPAPNVFAWSSIISAHIRPEHAKEGIRLYRRMRQSALEPDRYVFVAALKACANARDLAAGKLVHGDVVDSGLETNEYVGSTLVDMYAKCGSLEDARKVFDRQRSKSVVTWSAMIAGYVQHGRAPEALELYEDMQKDGLTSPNNFTLASLLKACSSRGDLQMGKKFHADIVDRGLETDLVIGNSLIDMYAKCGSLEGARKVFDEMLVKDVVTWSAMIAGYAQEGHGQKSLELFARMQQEGITPDKFIYVSVLQACGSTGAIREGYQVHAQIEDIALEADAFVGSALVDMYAKFGRMDTAQNVFDGLSSKNVVTWNALINGYGQHNGCKMAMQCFQEMRRHGVDPDHSTFAILFVACSHVGLVDEGLQYFRVMTEEYGIMPTVAHITCIVDMLGRSGRVADAEAMLQAMPSNQDIVGWMALLSACRTQQNVEIGKRCFDRLIQLEPQQSASYSLMSDLYASAGRWADAQNIDSLMKAAGAEKKLAKALIEVNGKVHEFTVGRMTDDVALKLKSLNRHVEEEIGLPHPVPLSDEDKGDALCGHAEKLAVAFGLLNTPEGTTLLVTKNLRMCDNCHRGTKIISRIENREIVVRDAHCVHHFKHGRCSCDMAVDMVEQRWLLGAKSD